MDQTMVPIISIQVTKNHNSSFLQHPGADIPVQVTAALHDAPKPEGKSGHSCIFFLSLLWQFMAFRVSSPEAWPLFPPCQRAVEQAFTPYHGDELSRMIAPCSLPVLADGCPFPRCLCCLRACCTDGTTHHSPLLAYPIRGALPCWHFSP